MRTLLIPALLGFLTAAALAQQDPADLPEAASGSPTPPVVTIAATPPTKMEQVEQMPGQVITKRFSKVATIASDDGGMINVYAVTLQNSGGNRRQDGVAVEVVMHGGRVARTYLDSDEIEAFTDALGIMEKIDKPGGDFDDLEARYQSRGHLALANIDDGGSRMLVVHTLQVAPVTGVVSTATVRLRAGRAAELRQQIGAARDVLGRAN